MTIYGFFSILLANVLCSVVEISFHIQPYPEKLVHIQNRTINRHGNTNLPLLYPYHLESLQLPVFNS